jgi:hypothetical protein
MNTATLLRSRLLVCTFPLLAAACGSSANNPESASDSGAPGEGGVTDRDAASDGGGGGGDSGSSRDSASDSSTTGADAGSLVAVPLSSCIPTVYTMPVTLGGTQHFEMVLDTGSTTLGVAATGCSCGPASPLYTPGSTATDEKKTASSQYGSGSWSGEIYQDTVSLGTSPSAPTKLVAISSQSTFFEPLQCDSKMPGMQGIVGFGPSGAAVANTQGFFDAYVAANRAPDVFATQLCDTTGTLWLGGFDPAATTATPQYVPLDGLVGQLYYAINLSGLEVSGTKIPISGMLPDALVDTGTSIFVLGTPMYNALVSALEADAMFGQIFGAGFFPAANAQTQACKPVSMTKAALDAALPPLKLSFGTTATVTAAPTESYLVDAGNGQWCGAIAGIDQGNSFPIAAIMGAPVLRSSVVVFDRAQSRIGFAPHVACP